MLGFYRISGCRLAWGTDSLPRAPPAAPAGLADQPLKAAPSGGYAGNEEDLEREHGDVEE
ncbi:hypothetical protein EMIHUDRAFT_226069 [Emiliania huxleyi CCMP1516]|uniref:Uncharacterized protein n=2 Tax=Emiliania huxleyi TaxID=2903 RepID=A0A0D3KLE7_EMIH1|nr:hypothetical protein EMIHUDRAFT_226069 [Emiliania huxleyi CCMP1516]EOD36582.1 hypothetical protein EMIHUDRAFT_226069 [Emiliania huxleyi CCMP1516]|eukprot:XP_005789011.1 hypothetical protein EMIHUDRAFT_226069 [Emiliania huxleyi CCMP1516]